MGDSFPPTEIGERASSSDEGEGGELKGSCLMSIALGDSGLPLPLCCVALFIGIANRISSSISGTIKIQKKN
jgi:hypothetical protein